MVKNNKIVVKEKNSKILIAILSFIFLMGGVFAVNISSPDNFAFNWINSNINIQKTISNLITNENYTIEENIGNFSATALNQSFMTFDGVNDYVESADSSLESNLNRTSFSVSAWFIIPRNRTDSEWNAVLNTSTILWVKDDSPRIVYARNSSSGDLFFRCTMFNGTQGSDLDNFSIELTYNQWHHISCNFDESNRNFTMYYDGVLSGNKTGISNNIPTGKNVEIGKDDNPRYFNGGIDEVRIYNTTLTASQITEIYNSGRRANSSLPSDGLVLWYGFNENNGSTVYDISGNGNNGI